MGIADAYGAFLRCDGDFYRWCVKGGERGAAAAEDAEKPRQRKAARLEMG